MGPWGSARAINPAGHDGAGRILMPHPPVARGRVARLTLTIAIVATCLNARAGSPRAGRSRGSRPRRRRFSTRHPGEGLVDRRPRRVGEARGEAGGVERDVGGAGLGQRDVGVPVGADEPRIEAPRDRDPAGELMAADPLATRDVEPSGHVRGDQADQDGRRGGEVERGPELVLEEGLRASLAQGERASGRSTTRDPTGTGRIAG